MTRPDPGPRIRPTRAGETSIVRLLQRRAAEQGDELVYRFRPNLPAEEQRLTYAALDARARRLAAWLEREGLAGERVLLLFPAGLEFVEAFFACLYAGVIAVPAYPPRANRTLERIESMARDAGARAALVAAGQRERALEATRGSSVLSSLRWLARDEVEGSLERAAHASSAEFDPDAVAYLQYTSGSTSEPKGVMVSHRNVLENLETIAIGFAHDRESRALTWLPHFHDMGLIDGILQPVYSGFPTTILDPLSFLQNPARWFELITELSITHTGGPNFAYELASRRVEPDPEKYDLSSWAVAYNGAEPVRADTLERFARTFARCGFDRRALYPAYGLAEATLKVTGGDRGNGPRLLSVNRAALEAGRVDVSDADHQLVGSGHVAGETRVRIVRVTEDEATGASRFATLGDDEVGEIWVTGPSVARGYWHRPEETRATFQATLPNDPGLYLRTGDLGFLRDGELFVTGRAKDLIIVRGRNLYPQDLERTVEACATTIRAGGAAAFRLESNEEPERVAIVIEVERHGPKQPEQLLAAIRAAIVEAHEIDPTRLVLVKPGGVPRTSSGKVQRSACRRALEQGALPVLAEWSAPSPADLESSAADPRSPHAWLEARLARALGVAQVGLAFDQPLTRFGLDSLRATELAHEIEVTYGLVLQPGELLLAPSLASIAARLEEARAVAPAVVEPPPEECDLSAGQLALWFLQELAPESSAYTITSALRLHGVVDEARLVGALEQVVTRHASLRARIVRRAGGPRQRFDVPFAAMVERGQLDDDTNLSARLADLALRPFDLERGPLARFGLYRVGREWILLLSIHHLIADLWSLSVLLKDLTSAYQGGGGAEIRVEEMPPHPSEFVSWQSGLLEGSEGESLIRALRQELGGEAPATSLPTDRSRPPGQTFRGGLLRFDLAPATASALRDLAKARGVTLYALLLAAFQLLVARLSGEREVWIGAPAAGRTRARFRDLVAYLVNPIVVRGDFSADPTFLELLDETAARLARAQRTQDYPFARLVKELKARRDPSRSPLFDHMFELRATTELVRGDLAAGSTARVHFSDQLWAEAVEIDRRTAQFDLSVSATDHADRLSLEYEWNRDLYEAARVEGWHANFAQLLEAIAREPELPSSRLPLLANAESAGAIQRAAERTIDPAGAIHRLVEAHAAATPLALAAVHGDARLTYGELDRRAARLAARLRARGIGFDARVAVSMPKSLDLLVALLAIWKAGGAYLALDPTQPSERRRFLVADADARLVLVRRADASGDPGIAAPLDDLGAPLIAIDDEDPLALMPSVDARPPSPESLAYVVYTSGTTGRPKGVMVSHASYLSAYRAWDRAYDLARFHAHLQMASPSFDVFMGDVARAWGAGRPLVLVDRETLLDPPALAELCREHEVDFGDFLPATLRELATHLIASGEPLRQFQMAVVGSDAWFTADFPLFRAALGPRTAILNSYGVTEATIDSCFDHVTDRDLERSVPAIGRALQNSALYVLDRHLKPLPPGVRGELYLGGAAVARGYLGRPDLTAERFLPDPFGPPGTRMYRSGDQARRLLDGRVEFLGRGDTQVKIRGYRVEPAEIEAVLKQHVAVRDAAVVAQEQGRSRRLVAYVVSSADEATLRAHAADSLPAYMVPSAFVFLPELPLTANRKLDRTALPAPSVVAELPELRAARGGAEETLSAVWREVLALEQVGVHDNFFELGGDSILAIQVVSRARERGDRGDRAGALRAPDHRGTGRGRGRDPAEPGVACPREQPRPSAPADSALVLHAALRSSRALEPRDRGRGQTSARARHGARDPRAAPGATRGASFSLPPRRGRVARGAGAARDRAPAPRADRNERRTRGRRARGALGHRTRSDQGSATPFRFGLRCRALLPPGGQPPPGDGRRLVAGDAERVRGGLPRARGGAAGRASRPHREPRELGPRPPLPRAAAGGDSRSRGAPDREHGIAARPRTVQLRIRGRDASPGDGARSRRDDATAPRDGRQGAPDSLGRDGRRDDESRSTTLARPRGAWTGSPARAGQLADDRLVHRVRARRTEAWGASDRHTARGRGGTRTRGASAPRGALRGARSRVDGGVGSPPARRGQLQLPRPFRPPARIESPLDPPARTGGSAASSRRGADPRARDRRQHRRGRAAPALVTSHRGSGSDDARRRLLPRGAARAGLESPRRGERGCRGGAPTHPDAGGDALPPSRGAGARPLHRPDRARTRRNDRPRLLRSRLARRG
ncbi:MAG: amino acid adenylation domain-containing protein [Candidatus Eisenbacteria bacterium]